MRAAARCRRRLTDTHSNAASDVSEIRPSENLKMSASKPMQGSSGECQIRYRFTTLWIQVG
jgi:hypothetical protein